MIVITGAGGFLGSHLADRYLADGHKVLGVDNWATGSPRNLMLATGSGRFSFVEMDASGSWEPVRATVAAEKVRIDLVLHFASPASPVDYAERPVETLRVNSQGTWNALRFAIDTGARFLYASTSETYGDPLVSPQSESYWGNVNPIGVRSCYDEAKRFGEALVMAFVRAYAADARIVRIFNTYGPRMRVNDGRVVPNFIAQALQGYPLTIYGSGDQTRALCYVDDLVEGIVRCAASERTRGLVVNLGNPDERTIREIAAVVSEVAGVSLRTVKSDLPQDDPTRRCPDISRAHELLNWRPLVDLHDGLRRTIDFFRDALTP